MQRRFVLKSGLILAALGVAGCAQQEEGADIVDIISSSPNHTTLTQAVAASGLIPTLKGEGPFTVFAPDDAAFDKLPGNIVANVTKPANRALLQEVLEYHVVPGLITSDQVLGQRLTVTTVNGQDIVVDGRGGGKSGPGVTVNGCNVVQPDILATNGVIHSIDCVLVPEVSAPAVAALR
ncbi:MAG: fasciclin domain-containing protein [Pseudomonadota bacterium]